MQADDEHLLLVEPPTYATNEDWAERLVHLQDVHKFGKCDKEKKFFRADHFRQHITHAHDGITGNWMAFLERACYAEMLTGHRSTVE